MNIKKINKKIIQTYNLIKKNIKANIQIKVLTNKETNLKIKNQKLENINYIKNRKIYITIYKNYKKINIICNNFKKKYILKYIKYINNNIKYISTDKYNQLPDYNLYNKKYESNLGIIFNDNISIIDMIQISKNIEKNTLNLSKNLISEGITFNKTLTNIWIYNDYKKIKNFSSKLYLIIVDVIIKNKYFMEQDYIYIYSHKLLDIINKYHYLSKKIFEKINKKLNIKKIYTKKTSIIFNNETSTEIFQYLSKIINGYNIYNQNSCMINKINKKILPKWMNIIEDPFIYKGIGSKPFDLEGLNTYKYNVVKKGKLKTWILDTYSSRKLNIKNTCNSGGIHNWRFINKKNISFKKIIKKMNNGLIIDKLLGQGVNITTGTFSKGASGFKIKNGKIKHFINEITISGNLKKIFKNIIYMSNDINTNSNIRAGSILIYDIQITGKNCK